MMMMMAMMIIMIIMMMIMSTWRCAEQFHGVRELRSKIKKYNLILELSDEINMIV